MRAEAPPGCRQRPHPPAGRSVPSVGRAVPWALRVVSRGDEEAVAVVEVPAALRPRDGAGLGMAPVVVVPAQQDAQVYRGGAVVAVPGESAWGAVPGSLRVRFPRPLTEPDMRLSPHPALHESLRARAGVLA